MLLSLGYYNWVVAFAELSKADADGYILLNEEG